MPTGCRSSRKRRKEPDQPCLDLLVGSKTFLVRLWPDMFNRIFILLKYFRCRLFLAFNLLFLMMWSALGPFLKDKSWMDGWVNEWMGVVVQQHLESWTVPTPGSFPYTRESPELC